MWPGVPEDELADEAAHHVVSPQRSLSAGHGAGGDFLAPAGAPSRFAGDSACSYTSAMRGSQEWAPAPASQGTKRQLSTVSADCLSGGVAPRTPQRHPGLPTGYGIAANGGSSPMRFGQSCDEGLQRLQQPARSFSTASASHMGDSGHLRGNGRPSAFPRASNDSWDSNDDTELVRIRSPTLPRLTVCRGLFFCIPTPAVSWIRRFGRSRSHFRSFWFARFIIDC